VRAAIPTSRRRPSMHDWLMMGMRLLSRSASGRVKSCLPVFSRGRARVAGYALDGSPPGCNTTHSAPLC
jgi:hypothetical protein